MTRRFLLLSLCALAGCRSGQPIEGLAPARDTGGPRIAFDLTRKPLPEMPFPTDLAARPDPGSPTGLRVNSSLAAPSQLEQRTRVLVDQLDGFGTFAPITVSFDAGRSDLDVADLFARQNDADPTNDGVYLVQIDDGRVWPLDFGAGHFPYVLADPGRYFPNDPFAQHGTLLFPGCGAGANVLVPPGPACDDPNDPDRRRQADQFLPFYERSTRTLIARPVLPLAQEKRYAVILTDRVRDAQGRAVVPPGSGVNHPAQNGELAPVLGRLPPGVRVQDIAYAWAFTTQSTTRDLEAIQRGLRLQGPLAGIGFQYPPATSPLTPTGRGTTLLTVLPERDRFALTDPLAYRLPADELAPILSDPAVAPFLGTPDAATLSALLETFRYIDYFVSGKFVSPSFIGVPSGAPQEGTFQIDLASGQAHTQPEDVTFLLAVPKSNGAHVPPFPTVLTGHGYTGTRSADLLAFAGTFAKYGLATISIDAYGHGLDPTAFAPVAQSLAGHGLRSFANALLTGRARDLDNDGLRDPGGDFFSADAFHTRDAVRQSVVDWMMLVRILRSFDGTTAIVQPAGPSGAITFRIAGDFNGDGKPDVAGPVVWPVDVANPAGGTFFNSGDANPGSDLFAFGVSLGGILAGVLPAVEPAVKAAAPVSGGAGLSDVALRSQLAPVVSSVTLGALGPFFTSCDYDFAAQRCAPGQAGTAPTLALVVQDLNRERELPIAPLALAPGDQVTLTNLDHDSATCQRDHACATATADANGKMRVAVTADGPLLSVQRVPQTSGADQVTATVLQPGDRLRVSVVRSGGTEPQNIDTFGFPVAFFGVSYQPGDALTAPASGWGYERNTPDLRRLVALSQAILEPGDPVSYAPHWSANLLPVRNGVPAPALVVGTVGDTAVPVSAAIAMARAAGLVEMTQPDPAYGIPMDQVLIRAGVVEGIANLKRLADPTSGPLAALGPQHLSCAPPADCTSSVLPDVPLVDPTSYGFDPANGVDDGLSAPRLNPPLRSQLARPVRLADGSQATSALLLPYLARAGRHGFKNPQPGKFDMDQFLANLIGRWFETRGRELHFEPCQAKEPPDCAWIPAPPP
ncbi:MAG: hypothetical protein ACJ79H_10515 [Myxococcales bacterium]